MKTKSWKSKIFPKKSLGQNFLINKGILQKIVTAADIKDTDTILETGPGKGSLTELLARRAKKVIAIEKDHRLIDPLKKHFYLNNNVTIVEEDILKFQPKTHNLTSYGYKIVANIPYYITSHFLKTIFTKWPLPELIVLTIQKEVAQRICIKPSLKNQPAKRQASMNILALSVQFYAKVEIIVSRKSFIPAPKVDSAVIRLLPHRELPSGTQQKIFFKVIHAGFSAKRKKLLNNLSNNLFVDKEYVIKIFQKLSLNNDIRAQNVSFDQWKEIAKYLGQFLAS